MISLYVASTAPYSGKSLICMGMGRRFLKDGYVIGYMKPMGNDPIRVGNELTDGDAVFIEHALELEEPPRELCPVIVTPDLKNKAFQGEMEDLEEKIRSSHAHLSKGKDIMLIGGVGDMRTGWYLGISGYRLAETLDTKVIVVDKYDMGVNLDSLLALKKHLGDRLIGVILNRVYESKIDYLQRVEIPFLEAKGVKVLGIIPHDIALFAVSVEKLCDVLGGEFICGEQYKDNMVERFSVGAMNVESALRFFRRIKNKAVITGGDRADIQLAALETSTRVIVLTGGLYPNELIISRAEQKKVPLILVKSDTLTTIERFEQILGRLSIREGTKVERANVLINEKLDFDYIYQKLGLSSSTK